MMPSVFIQSRSRGASVKATLMCFILGLAVSAWSQTGLYTLNGGTGTQTSQTYAATAADQSSVLVLNSGKLTLTGCTLTKTGDASNVNNSSQYGLNAGVLVESSGTVTISGSTVATNASGGNGLFATGSGSSVSMSGGSINASGGGAHGVDATYGGAVSLTSVDVTTTGSNSSALATDFGGGTVTVTGGTISASSTVAGSHSAGIYSTGSISVSGANVSSLADCCGVIDGANSITLANTALSGVLEGFKLWKTAPASGTATVTITGGSVTVSAGDGFYITGSAGNAANGTITLKSGVKVAASTGNLMNVDQSSTATFTADADTLTGNLITDNTSSLAATLKNNARLTGYIKTAALTMDGSSVWTLTAASYLTAFSDAAGISGTSITNIVGNGHSVHYDSSLTANRTLGGLVYSLVNGGVLTPGSVATGITESGATAPAAYLLRQNCPNPFNPTTSIPFEIPQRGQVRLVVFDVLGREVAVLVDGFREAGSYTVQFNGAGLASGVYLCRLSSGGSVQTRKMVFQK